MYNQAKKLAIMGCGIEMINSCIDRGNIQASISNCNQAIKYFKTCIKNYRETKQDFWIESGINHLMPYYNKLLAIEHLVKIYHELYQEKYCKSKLIAEKLIDAKYI